MEQYTFYVVKNGTGKYLTFDFEWDLVCNTLDRLSKKILCGRAIR